MCRRADLCYMSRLVACDTVGGGRVYCAPLFLWPNTAQRSHPKLEGLVSLWSPVLVNIADSLGRCADRLLASFVLRMTSLQKFLASSMYKILSHICVVGTDY